MAVKPAPKSKPASKSKTAPKVETITLILMDDFVCLLNHIEASLTYR